MIKSVTKALGVLCICTTLSIAGSFQSAAQTPGPGYETSSSLIVKIDAASAIVYTQKDEKSSAVTNVTQNNTYQVLENTNDGWVKISANQSEGYLKVAGNGSLLEKTEETKEAVEPTVDKRQQVVDYALQFVGGRYVYGGNDPRTGVDCSGFTRYVMKNSLGINLNRSSTSQSSQGRSISSTEMKPGDLIFYGSGRSINHVAMYIGNGQVVHASTEKTGIKISNWNYRTHVKIIDVIG